MPLYLQLKDLIKYFISTGAIHDGDQLPGVVQLAKDLKINFETVRKAYKELEKEKLLAMSPGRGTFATLHKDAVRKIKAKQDGETETPLRPRSPHAKGHQRAHPGRTDGGRDPSARRGRSFRQFAGPIAQVRHLHRVQPSPGPGDFANACPDPAPQGQGHPSQGPARGTP